ncbi:MAG: type II/IV secretion system protein [Rhodothermales bacterium]|nr:type II/IV secretion system protein [Rhodothermales bacterium]
MDNEQGNTPEPGKWAQNDASQESYDNDAVLSLTEDFTPTGGGAVPYDKDVAGKDLSDASDLRTHEDDHESHVNLDDDFKHLNIRDRVVVILLHKKVVTPKQVEAAQEDKKSSQSRDALWRFVARNAKDVEREAIFAEAASVYAFRKADIGPGKPDAEFVKLVIEALSEENRDKLLNLRVLPVAYGSDSASGGAKLVLATHDPARPDLHRFLQGLRMGRFELQYAPESEIKEFYRILMPKKNEFLERITDDPMAVDLGMSFDAGEKELIDEEALEAEISRSSLINLFEAALVEATRSGASDIHIFPNAQRKIDIYFRVDGRLSRWHTEDRVHPESFLAVVKDNAMNVDRFERDMAQDGFIQRQIDDALIRFRVSVLPIATASQEVRAESIVIRVLDDRKVLTDLRKLGMLDVALDRFDKAIHQPHGMVILTGPTGSGKSTTLVAALHQVVSPEVNVLTVEDPVEYIIHGVRQIKLGHKLSLEGALRAILRHDPDIVMVGEMRDQATAELAIKLANTGHLTFSTLHTNDAPSAVSRLYKMGVEPFLLAYAINLIVAQRLIRNLCPTCKVEDPDPDLVLLKSVGFEEEEIENLTFYKPGDKDNCKTCHGIGYKGRRAMCETLYFSREIRHMIVEAGEAIDEDEIREQGRSEGMLTLLDSAREIVKTGGTSVEELIRVTSTE